MINLLTKKRVLWGSIGTTLLMIFLLWLFDINSSICAYYDPPILACVAVLIAYMSIIFVPIVIFSFVTYRMKEEVYILWRKFTIIYLSFYLFIVLIAPWEHADYFSIAKDSMAFYLSIIYVVASCFALLYQFTKKKHVILYSFLSILGTIILADMFLQWWL